MSPSKVLPTGALTVTSWPVIPPDVSHSLSMDGLHLWRSFGPSLKVLSLSPFAHPRKSVHPLPGKPLPRPLAGYPFYPLQSEGNLPQLCQTSCVQADPLHSALQQLLAQSPAVSHNHSSTKILQRDLCEIIHWEMISEVSVCVWGGRVMHVLFLIVSMAAGVGEHSFSLAACR